MRQGTEQEEVVFEFTPEPVPHPRPAVGAPGATSSGSRAAALTASTLKSEGIDLTATPAREAFRVFAQREQEASVPGELGGRRRNEFEALGSVPGLRGFEPPEQRLARLQAEVADLLCIVEGTASHEGNVAAADLIGADPAVVSAELRVLEQRLSSLARAGLARNVAVGGADTEALSGLPGRGTMSGSLISQLERLATGGAAAHRATSAGDGRVTYEINYTPSTGAIADSANIAALESSIAEVEKQLGVLEPTCPYADLQTAVVQLQKRLSLLDDQKLIAIKNGVQEVKKDLEQALAKKAELEGSNADPDLDKKVSQLYEFCHRWSATAASLPVIVSRLHALQSLHQQSASFTSRLSALEAQQDELAKLLETTDSSVQELGRGLQENMAIVKENMRSLEEKMSRVVLRG